MWSVVGVGWQTGDGLDDLKIFALTEDAMSTIEVRHGFEGDEELAATGVWTGVGHAQDARLVMTQRGVEFVFDAEAGAASPCAGGIAGLNHKVWHDAMEDDARVKGAVLDRGFGFGIQKWFESARESNKVCDRFGDLFFIEFAVDGAHGCLNGHVQLSLTADALRVFLQRRQWFSCCGCLGL